MSSDREDLIKAGRIGNKPEIERSGDVRVTDESAVYAGWDACVKDIYLLAESLSEQADTLPTDQAHARGFAAGQRYAAKRFSRAFGACSAKDADRVREALAALTTTQQPPTSDLMDTIAEAKRETMSRPETMRGPWIIPDQPHSDTSQKAQTSASETVEDEAVAWRYRSSHEWWYTRIQDYAGEFRHLGYVVEPLYSAQTVERLTRERDALAKAIDPNDNRPALMARIIMKSIENRVDADEATARAERAEAALAEAEKERGALREALTPSGDTKDAYIGEFYMGVTLHLRGQEEYRRVKIPWDSIKEIMAAISSRATIRANIRSGENG